ncbi:hypothetical protein [Tumebacillus flagellatus]|uniref:Uncharacterized protein n=1 Tax=Tumebacillus flagellatus TaxID=1157490 RepID=A0A074LXR4_9BACL|nr:hypothetical protein [Tumebacillus flagellatus]KEO84918.1 hypothetical protein EL26_02600 [Tumebacillus flagellatus]
MVFRKVVLSISACVVALGFGAIAAHAMGSNNTTSEQHKMTPQENAEHLSQIQTIFTKTGTFVRDDQAKIGADDVVVSDSLNANEDTTKIVTSYGTFVRQ